MRTCIILIGLAAALLVGCRREPAKNGKDTSMADPVTDTVTIVGALVELGRPPNIMPGLIDPEQTLSLRVESADGMTIAVGTVVQIAVKMSSDVPIVAGAQSPAPELDPAYFRVGRRFRIATTPANGRYYAKIDKGAIQALD